MFHKINSGINMIIFSIGLPKENLRDKKRFKKYAEGKCLGCAGVSHTEMMGILMSFSSAQRNTGENITSNKV